MKYRTLCVGLIAASLLGLSVMLRRSTHPLADSSAAASPSTVIRMILPNNAVSTLGIVAQQRGFFKEEGLQVETLVSTNAKMSNDMLIARQGDVTLGGGPPFNFLSYSEHPLRIIAQIQRARDTAVFARRDRGITSESELVGKRIGYLPGTVSFLYWAMLMERNGKNFSDYTMIPLQPPSMPAALVGGSIDAFVMWEPWGFQAVSQLPDVALRIGDNGSYFWDGLVYGHQEFLVEHPEATKSLLKAFLKAERFLTEHREEAIQDVSNYIHEDAAHLATRWGNYQFAVKLDPSLLESFKLNAKYIQKYLPEFTTKPTPQFRSFIDPTYLKAVAPERVRLP